MPDDELEKLRSNLVHAYDKPKPLTRRLIQAMKDRVRTGKKSRDQEAKKAKDAA